MNELPQEEGPPVEEIPGPQGNDLGKGRTARTSGLTSEDRLALGIGLLAVAVLGVGITWALVWHKNGSRLPNFSRSEPLPNAPIILQPHEVVEPANAEVVVDR
jgi:hypothetical protein